MTADDWARLRCHVVEQTGWTWDQVGLLNLDGLAALTAHWADHPSQRSLVQAIAAALGVQFKTPSARHSSNRPAAQPEDKPGTPVASDNDFALSALLGGFSNFGR